LSSPVPAKKHSEKLSKNRSEDDTAVLHYSLLKSKSKMSSDDELCSNACGPSSADSPAKKKMSEKIATADRKMTDFVIEGRPPSGRRVQTLAEDVSPSPSSCKTSANSSPSHVSTPKIQHGKSLDEALKHTDTSCTRTERKSVDHVVDKVDIPITEVTVSSIRDRRNSKHHVLGGKSELDGTTLHDEVLLPTGKLEKSSSSSLADSPVVPVRVAIHSPSPLFYFLCFLSILV